MDYILSGLHGSEQSDGRLISFYWKFIIFFRNTLSVIGVVSSNIYVFVTCLQSTGMLHIVLTILYQSRVSSDPSLFKNIVG